MLKTVKEFFQKNSEFFVTLSRVWLVLEPFHLTFVKYSMLVFLYEGLQILETYSLPGLIHLYDNKVQVWTWGLFFVFLISYDFIFRRFDNFLDYWIIKKHTHEVSQYLKNRVISKFYDLDLAWHDKNDSGKLIGTINKGLDKINEVIQTLSWEFVPSLTQVILSGIPLAILNWQVSSLLMLTILVFLKLTLDNHSDLKKMRKSRYDLYYEESQKSVAMIQSISTIRYGSSEKVFLASFQDLYRKIVKAGIDEAKKGIFESQRKRIFVLNSSKRIILFLFLIQLLSGGISLANLIFSMTLVEKLVNSVWRLSRLFDRLSEASEPAEKLVEFLKQTPVVNDTGTVLETDKKLDIVFDSVNFCYGISKGLDRISFKANYGQTIALVGLSGSGKSTLISALLRKIEVDGGILVGGVSVKDWKMSSLRELFAVVPQEPYIYDWSIRDNISMQNPLISLDGIIAASKKAGIHETILSFPTGYDNVVGERGIKLSGGQKQRVALARAFAKPSARILILDEATSAQDSQTESEIQVAIQSYPGTVIIIAHRLSTVQHADQILVLDQGKIVESGNHKQLIELGGLYSTLAGHLNLE